MLFKLIFLLTLCKKRFDIKLGEMDETDGQAYQTRDAVTRLSFSFFIMFFEGEINE